MRNTLVAGACAVNGVHEGYVLPWFRDEGIQQTASQAISDTTSNAAERSGHAGHGDGGEKLRAALKESPLGRMSSFRCRVAKSKKRFANPSAQPKKKDEKIRCRRKNCVLSVFVLGVSRLVTSHHHISLLAFCVLVLSPLPLLLTEDSAPQCLQPLTATSRDVRSQCQLWASPPP